MTPEQALSAVQEALAVWGLPGRVGIRQADRTFIVALAPGDRTSGPAVASLLEQMGCETHVSGFVYGKLAGGLRPAPPLPPRQVNSADTAAAAERATPTTAKLCRGCNRLLPLEEFSLNGLSPLGKPRRMHQCKPCDSARQARGHAARKAARTLSR